MALLDMIHETLSPTKLRFADESEGLDNTWHEEPEPYRPEVIPMDASKFLDAMESIQEMKHAGQNIPSGMSVAEQIHAALECGLPTSDAPYDPTEELDDIAATLAGIDPGDDIDIDQPQPDEGVDPSSTIEDLQNQPQDTH